ncbi:MAG: hypothetical protein K1Y36_11720 [Blastocatellia bacterium]|nr:hypothetical protein [Blastocatellia bacterium]
MKFHVKTYRFSVFFFSTFFMFVTVLAPILADTAGINRKSKPHNRKSTRARLAKPSKPAVAPFQPPVQEEEFEAEGDIKARERWFWAERAYPFDTIPTDARRLAWEARPQARFSPQANEQWVPIGPKPTNSGFLARWGETSGRINAIAVSPENSQIVLVGGATGGIWRSTDGGRQFIPVTDDQVDLAINAIVFAPSNPALVYAGLGDFTGGRYLGSGILKSTDAGQTWKRVSDTTLPAPGQNVNVVVDPVNPDRVYAAQFLSLRSTDSLFFAGGFYLSTNGGVSWRKTLSGLPLDLARDPANGQTLFLSMIRVDGNPNLPIGLCKSTDGGETWTNVYRNTYRYTYNTLVTVAPSDSRRVYQLLGGGDDQSNDFRLETSTDAGQTWTSRNLLGTVDFGQFGYNDYLSVDPTNPDVLYVGTRDVFKSTDAGKSWENLTRNFDSQGRYDPNRFGATSHSDQHVLTFDPKNPNRILIGNDGGISISEDSGKSFRSFNQTLTLTLFVSLAAHPTNPGIVYGGTQDNGTQRRQTTFGPWQEFVVGDGGNCVVDAVDSSKVFTTYIGTAAYRFGNNGDRFERTIGSNQIFGEPSNARVAFYPPFTGNGVNSTLYFGTWRLFISTDQGNTWTAPAGMLDLTKGSSPTTGTDVLRAIGVSASNPKVIYTGSSFGRVMTTSDGGLNWLDVTAGLPNRTITRLVVHPTKPETVYVTVSGFGTGHVFRSTNSGATWTNISNNLPNIPTNTLLIDPTTDETLYVGTDIGIFRSTTGGATWESFNQGMPPTIVMAMATRKDRSILAATYGRGAYELKTVITDTVPPVIRLLAPNGGEKFKIGNTMQISWQSSDDQKLARHDIALSTDAGTTYSIPVVTGLPGSTQTFAYVVPKFSVKTKAVRIRVTATDEAGNSASDASDGNFKIK